MPTTAKYRRTFFALVRELGVPPEVRHDLQEGCTGKRSTKDWDRHDWEKAIARLQRDLGQHSDATAHVREDRPGGVATEPGEWCSKSQAALVERLASEIEWTGVGALRDPVSFLLESVLVRPAKTLRRARILRAIGEQKAGEKGLDLFEIARLLTRDEVAGAIAGFRNLKRYHPVGEQVPTGEQKSL